MNKHKLCMVFTSGNTTVMEIDEDGNKTGDVVDTYQNDGSFGYAIYKNLGTEEDQDWSEWDYYGQDLEKAVKEFNKLKEN